MPTPTRTRANKKSGSGVAMIARLSVLLVVAGITLVLVLIMRSPAAISENDVRNMLASGELIGLPVEEATRRLQHAPPTPPTVDGTLILDFQHVRGWRAAAVELDVQAGRVVDARWEGTAVETIPR